MITVLHITTAIDWRGGEQQLSYILEETKKINVNLIVLSPNNSEIKKFCTKQKINNYSLKKSHGLSLNWALKIKRICQKDKVDIIHTHDSKSHTYAVLSATIFANKTPIVVHRKVIFKIKQSFLTKYKYKHQLVKNIICISKAVQNEVIKITKCSKTSLIYDAIKHENNISVVNLREKYNIPSNHKIVGYVAALSYEKDHITFLKTAHQLLKNHSNFSFFIIGNGSLKESIQSQIKTLNISQNVFLTGFIENAKYLIKQFDVLLFTSKSEGLGTTILDAFFLKIPVVTVKNGGAEELVIANKTGYICNKEDVLCLQQSVESVFNNSKIDKMIENAFQMVIKRHDTTLMANEIKTVYSKILDLK